MALSIASRPNEGVTVLDLSGRITSVESTSHVHEAVKDLIGNGQKRILLNLGEVHYIDSSGVGELIRAYVTARDNGASVKLFNLSNRVKYALDLTRTTSVFEVYDDESTAVGSYRS